MPVQRTPSRRTASSRHRRLAARRSGCRSARAAPSDGSATLSRIEASRCRPLALRSSVTSAMPSRRASRGEPIRDRRAVERGSRRRAARRSRRRASRGSRCGRSRAGRRCRAPRRRGRRSSTPSSTRRQPRRAGTSSDRPRTDEHRRAARRARGRGARRPVSRPTIAAMMRSRVSSAIGAVTHVAAVAQHRDPVGERHHLVDAVRDVDDRRRRRAASCRMIRKSRAHSAGDSAEVGSSMIRMRASSDSALAISTSCCSPMRRPADPRLRVELDAEPVEQRAARPRPSRGGRGSARPISGSRPRKMLAATLELRDEVQLLVDDGDARRARRRGRWRSAPAAPSIRISPS